MKITIDFNDTKTKDDFKAECYEALRSLELAKENILMELEGVPKDEVLARKWFGKYTEQNP